MIFDSHAHLVAADFHRYPPTPLSGKLDRPMDDPMTAEKLLQLMDAEGVDRAVAVQRAHVYGYNNDYVCDAAAAWPDRLVAVCCIDAAAADGAARARYWVEERGAVGLRLTEPFKGSGTGWFDSAQALAVWGVADALGVSLCLHMYRWNRLETLVALPAMLAQFPGVQVVLDHASNLAGEQGPPDFGIDPALAAMAHFPQVYQKLTTINFAKLAAAQQASAPVVRRLVQEFGPGRVFWGSDVAQSAGSYADLVAMARDSAADLDAAQRQTVLSEAARKLYQPRR